MGAAFATTLIPATPPSRNLPLSRSAQGLRSRGVSIVRGGIQVGPPDVYAHLWAEARQVRPRETRGSDDTVKRSGYAV